MKSIYVFFAVCSHGNPTKPKLVVNHLHALDDDASKHVDRYTDHGIKATLSLKY